MLCATCTRRYSERPYGETDLIKNLADGSNVPGVALYFYMLSAIRTELALVPWFARTAGAATSSEGKRSALAQLSSTGNLVAGAVARTSVGFVLNPITVIKARFEVR